MGALGGGLEGLVSEGHECAAGSLSTNRFCPGGIVPLLVCVFLNAFSGKPPSVTIEG